VAYDVGILDRDEQYLLTCHGLSDRDRVFAMYYRDLSEISDAVRLDPSVRLGPGSPLFRHHILFRENDTLYTLRLIVDDSAAAMGVLNIVYLDLIEGRRLRRI
jgi:hypothetical protein